MAQHYLRSSAYRDLTLGAIYAMREEEIHEMYVMARWNSLTHQGCPACGTWDTHYWRARRKQWRCKACGTDFTVTSRTAFANRKKSLKHILAMIFHYVSDVPPILSSTSVWSPIPYPKEIGREEAFYRRADHRLPARSR
ncbi:IS1595 family transposase, partial [Xanthomonas citri pv. eucalyptorum]|uniref:transposase n=1 Tax=Xanthomonas citri TaxID=346 RepID=UPI000FD225A0